IEWAINNKCQIASMSLGAPAFNQFGQVFGPVMPGENIPLPGGGFSPLGTTFNAVGERALRAGTLLIAAAGNRSNRLPGDQRFAGNGPPGTIRPVDRPANANPIMAIGALDINTQVGLFSNGTAVQEGGQVDMAAPGVDILSSVPRIKGGMARMDGTSM